MSRPTATVGKGLVCAHSSIVRAQAEQASIGARRNLFQQLNVYEVWMRAIAPRLATICKLDDAWTYRRSRVQINCVLSAGRGDRLMSTWSTATALHLPRASALQRK